MRRIGVIGLVAGALVATASVAVAYPPPPAPSVQSSCTPASQTVQTPASPSSVLCSFTFYNAAGQPVTAPFSATVTDGATSSTVAAANGVVSYNPALAACNGVNVSRTVIAAVDNASVGLPATQGQSSFTITCLPTTPVSLSGGCTPSSSAVGGYLATCTFSTDAPDGSAVSFSYSGTSSYSAASTQVVGGSLSTQPLFTSPSGGSVTATVTPGSPYEVKQATASQVAYVARTPITDSVLTEFNAYYAANPRTGLAAGASSPATGLVGSGSSSDAGASAVVGPSVTRFSAYRTKNQTAGKPPATFTERACLDSAPVGTTTTTSTPRLCINSAGTMLRLTSSPGNHSSVVLSPGVSRTDGQVSLTVTSLTPGSIAHVYNGASQIGTYTAAGTYTLTGVTFSQGTPITLVYECTSASTQVLQGDLSITG